MNYNKEGEDDDRPGRNPPQSLMDLSEQWQHNKLSVVTVNLHSFSESPIKLCTVQNSVQPTRTLQGLHIYRPPGIPSDA